MIMGVRSPIYDSLGNLSHTILTIYDNGKQTIVETYTGRKPIEPKHKTMSFATKNRDGCNKNSRRS